MKLSKEQKKKARNDIKNTNKLTKMVSNLGFKNNQKRYTSGVDVNKILELFKSVKIKKFGKRKGKNLNNKEKQKLINNFKKVNKNFKEEQYKLSVFNLLLGSGLLTTAILIFLIFFVKNPEDDNNLDDNNVDDSLISKLQQLKTKEEEKNFKKLSSQNKSGIDCKKDGCINEDKNIYNYKTKKYDVSIEEFNKATLFMKNYDRIAKMEILEKYPKKRKKYHQLLEKLKDPKKPLLKSDFTSLKRVFNLYKKEKDKPIRNVSEIIFPNAVNKMKNVSESVNFNTPKTNIQKSNTKKDSKTTPGEVLNFKTSKNKTLKNTSKRHNLKELQNVLI